MKQFNLDEYLKNPNVEIITRDGRKVTRILCTDVKGEYPIVALIEAESENGFTEETVKSYTKDGRYNKYKEWPCDLFFAVKKHEGWVNIYRNSSGIVSYCGRIYNSEDEAKYSADNFTHATIKIEWEEE